MSKQLEWGKGFAERIVKMVEVGLLTRRPMIVQIEKVELILDEFYGEFVGEK